MDVNDFLDTWVSELSSFFINNIIVPIVNTLNLKALLPPVDSQGFVILGRCAGYVNAIFGDGVIWSFISYGLGIIALYFGAKIVLWLYDKITSVT